MQGHTALAGEAQTASTCRYKWSGHVEIAVSVLGREPPDLNSHSLRPQKDMRYGRYEYRVAATHTYLGRYVHMWHTLNI